MSYPKYVYRLIRIDHDNLENREPIHTKTIGLFMDDDNSTAHGKISDYFKKQPPEKLYFGWDGKVYPKFKIEQELVK